MIDEPGAIEATETAEATRSQDQNKKKCPQKKKCQKKIALLRKLPFLLVYRPFRNDPQCKLSFKWTSGVQPSSSQPACLGSGEPCLGTYCPHGARGFWELGATENLGLPWDFLSSDEIWPLGLLSGCLQAEPVRQRQDGGVTCVAGCSEAWLLHPTRIIVPSSCREKKGENNVVAPSCTTSCVVRLWPLGMKWARSTMIPSAASACFCSSFCRPKVPKVPKVIGSPCSTTGHQVQGGSDSSLWMAIGHMMLDLCYDTAGV